MEFEEYETEEVEAQLETAQAKVGPKEFTVEDKLFSALSYISLLFIVPLILRPDSDEINFHAKQGMVLFGAQVVTWIIFEILNAFVSILNIFSALAVIDTLGRVAWLIFVGISAASIYFVIKGRQWMIPVIGKIAKRLEA